MSIEAECNDCEWKGLISEMKEELDECGRPNLFCPLCGFEDIYYF